MGEQGGYAKTRCLLGSANAVVVVVAVVTMAVYCCRLGAVHQRILFEL